MKEMKSGESGEILSGTRGVVSGISDLGGKIEDLWRNVW